MDEKLCDELLQEIFTKLPSIPDSSSSTSIPLVSKRWLHLYRTSKTSLSIRINPQNDLLLPSLPSLLNHYPSLSALSILPLISYFDQTQNLTLSDQLLLIVFLSCSNLSRLIFLLGPVSRTTLFSLSTVSSSRLTSLTLPLSRPVSFNWVAWFPCLIELSVHICSKDGFDEDLPSNSESGSSSNEKLISKLGLESVSISGIRSDDSGVSWLWRNCQNLTKLKLKGCSSIADIRVFSSCLQKLEEIELRTCRSIIDLILLTLTEHCSSLRSLLIYDGGSAEGFLQFIQNSRFNLHKLDLRLPLDLNDTHLSAMAVNFRGLLTLRLQSCCLVTGEGLKTLAMALSPTLEELSLVNCIAIEREPGLLTTLGQHLGKLRKLELAYNESLPDKELVSTMVSCGSLIDLRLRGCKILTGVSLMCLVQCCKKLRSIDVLDCHGIDAEDVEMFVRNSPRLRRILVEESKIRDVARSLAVEKSIEFAV